MALLDRPYGPVTGNPSGLGVVAQNTLGATVAPLPALQTFNTTTETVVVNPTNTTLALTVSIEPNTNLEQVPFDLNISGYITTGASMTVTAKLYSGTSTTVASDTLLGSSGAITQNSSSAPFAISAKLIFDSVSGKLTGTVKFLLNNTLVAEAAISNVITGIKNSNTPVASFLASFTFSVANAANVVNVQKFSVG
jgi:hypothetical protein